MPEIPKRILVVSPHPDDAEFGCSGTMALWGRQGAEVVYVLCTNGDKGTSDPEMTSARLAALREQEQRDACQTLGVKEVIFLGHGDGELEDNRVFRGELVRAIRYYKPEALFAPNPFRQSFNPGGHRDHRMGGQVALDAVYPFARDHLHFPEHMREGLTPHKVREVYLWGSDSPDFYVDISETIESKAKALLCHRSQFVGREQQVVEMVKQMSQRIGKEKEMAYAEAFRRLEFRL